METVRLYTSSAWNRLAEKLNLDPQKRVCTFKLKVVLTTLIVCGMLFGAAGIAVLRGVNSPLRHPHLSQAKVIDGADLEKMIVANATAKVEKVLTVISTIPSTAAFTDSITEDEVTEDVTEEVTEEITEEVPASTPLVTTLKSHFGPLSIDNRRDSRDNHNKETVTTKDLLNALGKDSQRKTAPCPPGQQLVKKVVTEEVISEGLNGGSLISYSTRLICKVPNGLPWYLKPTTARPKTTKSKSLKINTVNTRNAKKPITKNVNPKILKVVTTKKPNGSLKRSTPFRRHPKTIKRPKGKVVHHPVRKATTPRRRLSLQNHRTTRRPSLTKRKNTFAPHNSPKPSSPSPWDWNKWKAKMIARWCARLCQTNRAAGGHICHCDDPPME